jgi:hypothetical protein
VKQFLLVLGVATLAINANAQKPKAGSSTTDQLRNKIFKRQRKLALKP